MNHFQFIVPTLFGMEGLALFEIGAEIPVQELHAVLRRRPFGSLPHQLVVLIGADEEGRGEAVEAPLSGLTGRLPEAGLPGKRLLQRVQGC